MTSLPKFFTSKKKTEFKKVPKTENMPDDYFRLLICGPSGSGKTNTLMHLLFAPLLWYDKIILYAKNLDQPYYQELIRRFEKIADKLNVDLDSFIKVSNEEVQDIDEIDDDMQKIVIFDDYICSDKDRDAISKYFIGGRHKKCSVIYLTQSYYKTPKECRLNCSHYMIFDFPSKNERDLLCNELQVDKQHFVEATKDPYHFLYINRPKKKIFHCLDKILGK